MPFFSDLLEKLRFTRTSHNTIETKPTQLPTIPSNIVEKYHFNLSEAWYLTPQISTREPLPHDIYDRNKIPPTVDPNKKVDVDSPRYIVENRAFIGESNPWARSRLYRAWDTHLETIVVVKASNEYELPRGSTNELEALTMAKIDHPNIPKIYDFIRKAPTPHGATNCLVEEFIDGINVGDIIRDSIKNGESPTIERIIKIIQTASEVTSYLSAHHNLLTYDTKPGNLIERKSDGKVFLIDFEISNWAIQITDDMNLGTTPYVAPEVLQDPTLATPASDVYALAIMAYELLTSNWPYTTAPQEVRHYEYLSLDARDRHAHHTLNTPPNPISNHKGIAESFNIPDQHTLDSIFNQALAKNPAARYRDPLLFFRELYAVLSKIEPQTKLSYQT